MSQMFLMISVYVFIIITLNRQMKQLKGDFRDEILSINAQFAVYLFAYAIRALFYFCDFITMIENEHSIFSNFKGAIF